MFLGNIGGCIGETSALLLIIGFIYLLYRKVITARIPLAYIGTVAILAFLFPQGNDRIALDGRPGVRRRPDAGRYLHGHRLRAPPR